MYGVLMVLSLLAGDTPKAAEGARQGVAPDLTQFPQSKPEETLASILKGIELKKWDYLAAQLADPDFIDERVKTFGGRFAEVVDDLRARLDPSTVKLLQRYQKDGEWRKADRETMVALKDVPDRFLFFRKIGDRWYLEHRSKPGVKPR